MKHRPTAESESVAKGLATTVQVASLALAIVAMAAVIVSSALRGRFDHDEVEHAHATWQVAQGFVPYVDFFQIHLPTVWYLSAPLLRLLPHTTVALVVLRFSCVAAFLLSCWAGVLILKRAASRLDAVNVALMLAAALALVLPTQAQRFRPDPFMALFATVGMLHAMRGVGGNGRSFLYSGIFFGFAAALSPKVVPLWFVLPGTLALDRFANRTETRGALIGWYAVGLLVGITPCLLLLLVSGNLHACFTSVFGSYVGWLLGKSTTPGPGNKDLALAFAFLALILVAGINALTRHVSSGPKVPPPKLILLISSGLTLVVMLAAYNRSMYNLQAGIIAVAVLTSIVVTRLLSTARIRALRTFGVLIFSVLCVLTTSLEARSQNTDARRVARDDLESLITMVQGQGLSVQLFMPFHPVFTRNVSSVYSQAYAARENWREMVRTVIDRRPHILVDRTALWQGYSRGLLTRHDYEDLCRMVDSLYVSGMIGSRTVLVRRDTRRALRRPQRPPSSPLRAASRMRAVKSSPCYQ